ncbi:MAG: response regulator transcription factor [Bacteroidota bacterium]
MIRIAIADDEALFRKGMGLLISEFDGMELAWEVGDGQELLDKLATLETLPDVLLLDLNMPRVTGIDAAKVIQKTYPQIRMVIISTYFSKSFILNMIELGATSYLPKNTQPAEVEKTIREVVDKGFSYNQAVMEVMRDQMMQKSRPKPVNSFGVTLTGREKEVLQLICEEYTTAEIAEKLFLSARTVDGHRNNLLQKLNCRNTAGLVVYAIQHQMVNIQPDSFWDKKA